MHSQLFSIYSYCTKPHSFASITLFTCSVYLTFGSTYPYNSHISTHLPFSHYILKLLQHSCSTQTSTFPTTPLLLHTSPCLESEWDTKVVVRWSFTSFWSDLFSLSRRSLVPSISVRSLSSSFSFLVESFRVSTVLWSWRERMIKYIFHSVSITNT